MNARNLTYAKYSTIPTSLRHPAEEDILQDALALVSFLQASAAAIAATGDALSEEQSRGLNLCFSMTHDKLEILTGGLSFPLCGLAGEHAHRGLWNPDKDGSDE